MNFWEGYMNWKLVDGWKCQTCGSNDLIWGLVHAQCRCNVCHTQYYMRDDNGNITDNPICLLKDEYKEPAKIGWNKYNLPLSVWDDEMWNTAFEECKRIKVK